MSGEAVPMDGEVGLSCPQCSAARDIYRYCMNCGFDYSTLPDHADSPTGADSTVMPTYAAPAYAAEVVEADTAERPAVPIQPVLPPVVDNEPNRVIGGRSAPVVLGLVAVAVFALILIGAAVFALMGSDDKEPAAESDTSASENSSDTPSNSGGAQPTCWDGTEVASISECSEPTGTEGLAWVFPSFDPQECNQKRDDPAKWNCTVETADGGEVQIRYREHGAVQRPQTAYTAKYGLKNRTAVLSAREDVERYVWRAPRPNNNGVWALSSMYAEHPWSVTIKGLKSDDVESAFNDNVEFRNPRRITGSPA